MGEGMSTSTVCCDSDFGSGFADSFGSLDGLFADCTGGPTDDGDCSVCHGCALCEKAVGDIEPNDRDGHKHE
jgi:hypothetical protein